MSGDEYVPSGGSFVGLRQFRCRLSAPGSLQNIEELTVLGDPVLKTDELTGRDVHATFFGDCVTDQADRACGAEEAAVPAV